MGDVLTRTSGLILALGLLGLLLVTVSRVAEMREVAVAPPARGSIPASNSKRREREGEPCGPDRQPALAVARELQANTNKLAPLSLDFAASEMSPSLEALLTAALHVQDLPVWDEELDWAVEAERCERYNWQLGADHRTTRRRVFWGSLVNDDSWHIMAMHAMEAYGIYDTAALVESNTTFLGHPRDLRFGPDSTELKTLQSGMWGPTTRISVDTYVDPPAQPGQPKKVVGAHNQENEQRAWIEKRWKENGMTPEDIGYLGDLDEVVTRDMLRALQICDVPQFRPGQSCKDAKLHASTLIIESSPMCVMEGRRWYHPDVIIGECIDGIGDEREHAPQTREPGYWGDARKADWGKEKNRTGGWPLWTAQDFRMTGSNPPHELKGRDGLYGAFHLHNYFSSIQVMRNKYLTYGHPVHGAMEKPLGLVHVGDVDFMVDCVMDRPETSNEFKRVKGGYLHFSKSDGVSMIPVAFQRVPHYPKMRHADLRQMIIEDEKLHPTNQSLIHPPGP